MKEEALKLADELEDEAKYGECDWTSPRVSATMIRRLVEHIEELENPIMQAISMAFTKPLSDEEIKVIATQNRTDLTIPAYISFARAIEERHGIK